MANMLDYLDWRGDLPFTAAPFCPVDNLILSFLSYLDFEGLVPDTPQGAPTLAQLTPVYFARRPRELGPLGILIPIELFDLLEHAAASPRFAPLRVWGQKNRLEHATPLQFSATSFSLGNGCTFVAYRGTDDTIAGWHEDMNMTLQFPIPAQEEALTYLQTAAALTGDRLYLGGHSKGGNLAVYAAALAPPEVQARILHVWSNDGPGFPWAFFRQEGYPTVEGRLTSLLPRSSIVGMMLRTQWEQVFVESSALSAFQHDPLTWQVLGPNFIRAREQSRSSQQAQRAFYHLLHEMDRSQRRQLISDIFSLAEEVGARTLTDLTADSRRLKVLRGLSSRLTGLDAETRDSLFRALKLTLKE